LSRFRSTTTSAVLEGLHDAGNESVWREIDDRFRPVIIGVAQKLGLTPADAADAAQESLIQFFQAYHACKYDRSRGRLRQWMFGIARKRIADAKRKRARHREQASEFIDDMPANEPDLARLWDDECRRVMLRDALVDLSASCRVKPQTIRAFKLFAIDGRPAQAVAQEVGVTVQAVYMAKFHCLTHLRGIVARLEQEYGLDEDGATADAPDA